VENPDSPKWYLREWLWRAEDAYRLVELELIAARGKLVGEAGDKFVRLWGIMELTEHAAVIAVADMIFDWLLTRPVHEETG
jgi:hypothetical protein